MFPVGRYKNDIARYKPIYDHARESFDLTILPNPTVREHLDSLRTTQGNEPYIGVHIRRGDRIADNQKWHRDYVPVAEYSNAVSKAWQKLRETDEGLGESPNVYIATDSRAAYEDFKAFSTASDAVTGLFDAETSTLQYMAQTSGYIQPLWEKQSRIEERMVREHRCNVVLSCLTHMVSGIALDDWNDPRPGNDLWAVAEGGRAGAAGDCLHCDVSGTLLRVQKYPI